MGQQLARKKSESAAGGSDQELQLEQVPDDSLLEAESDGNDGADLIFLGGAILTIDESNPTPEALAVQGGRISAVGKASDVFKLLGPNTEVVFLQNDQTLLPGFIEPHSHAIINADTTSERYHDVTGSTCHSYADVKKVMDEVLAEAVPETPWLLFWGWDPILVRDLPLLSADKLDEYTTDYPVVVVAQNGHCAWVNHKAFEAAGVDDSTPNPPGGFFDHDSKGRLTGLVREAPGILAIISKVEPVPTPQETCEALLKSLKTYSSQGFTTVTEMAQAMVPGINELLQTVTTKEECPVRLGLYVLHDSKEKPAPGYRNPKLWYAGIKFFADGSPYAGTMAVKEPYLDNELTRRLGFPREEHPCGALVWKNADDLAAAIEPFHKDGSWLIAIHSHGERAIHQALEAYDKVLRTSCPDDHRYRMEHLGLVTDDQLGRAAELGVTATFYSDHIYYYGTVLRDEILGEERATRFTPVALATKHGIRWTLHQDTPCSPVSPLRCIKTAVTRKPKEKDSEPLGPDFCVSIDDAIKAYTINAAWQLKLDHKLGSLEVGKIADLLILSNNPKTVDPNQLEDIQVVATYLSGRCMKAPDEKHEAKFVLCA